MFNPPFPLERELAFLVTKLFIVHAFIRLLTISFSIEMIPRPFKLSLLIVNWK